MDYSARLQRLQEHLSRHQCDVLLIEEATNLFYMTGLELSAGKLLIDANGACLFVDSRYLETCQKLSPFPVILASEKAIPDWLCERDSFNTFGFDNSTTNVNRYQELKKQLLQQKKRMGRIKSFKLLSMQAPLRMLRCVKDAEEITLLKAAADLGSEGYDFVCNSLKSGISEQELALELDIFLETQGQQSFGF